MLAPSAAIAHNGMAIFIPNVAWDWVKGRQIYWASLGGRILLFWSGEEGGGELEGIIDHSLGTGAESCVQFVRIVPAPGHPVLLYPIFLTIFFFFFFLSLSPASSSFS